MFFQKGAIIKVPRFLKIWRDPKIGSIMYMKDMLRDWTFSHLSYCANILTTRRTTPTSKMEIQEKHEPKNFQGLGALGKETPNKKILEGAKGGEKDKFRSMDLRCKTRKMFPFNPRESRAWLGRAISSGNSSDFHSNNPN
jgi:hypothetical protein